MKGAFVGIILFAVLGFSWVANMDGGVGTPDSTVDDEQRLGGAESQDNGEEQTFGALTGPDIPSKFLRVGGVTFHYHHQNFSSATTTICSAQAPAATSTLQSVFAVFGNSSSTATTIDLGYGTNSNSTTTTITSAALAPNDNTHFSFASTTVIAPNTWVTIGMQGGDTGVFSPTGTCNIIFQSAI